MEKDLDPDIIKATQSSLGKYVKRPPLSEKLLRKPPFRFLHDIVTSVLKTTGFFEGLFEPDELISENVKDRDSKILFLNKVISVVGLTTGKPLAVKPSKIVAGQEADKTNELLQCLASVLDKKISSDEAVKQYKENGNLQQQNDKKVKEATESNKEKVNKVDSKKSVHKTNEKSTAIKKESGRTSIKNDSDAKIITKRTQKDNTTKNESPPRKTQQIKTNKRKAVERKVDVPDTQKKVDEIVNHSADSSINILNDIHNEQDSEFITKNCAEQSLTNIKTNDEPQLSADFQTEEQQLNSSLSSQDLMEVEGEKQTQKEYIEDHSNVDEKLSELDPRSHNLILTNSINDSIDKDDNTFNSTSSTMNNVKHLTDFEGEKKSDDKKSSFIETLIDQVKNHKAEEISVIPKSPLKSNQNGTIRPKSVRPSSSRPGAPRLRDKHDNILTEAENLVVGKVNIITENTQLEEEEDSSLLIIEQEKKSLSTQEQQEQFPISSKSHGHLVQQILDSQKEFSKVSGKTEIEWEFGAQKAREAVNKEIEQLKYNIQGLSRVANPVGKILDHIQEDVEVMRQELQQWTKIYIEASKELLKQKTLNEDSLSPLRPRVNQLELDIKEKHEKINDLKVVVHKNSSRIEKLLACGDVQ